MTGERLAELERLCEAATPGPWYAPEQLGGHVWGDRALGQQSNEILYHHKVADCTYHADGGFEQRGQNAAFIAAARTALPELIAEVRRLWAEVVNGSGD